MTTPRQRLIKEAYALSDEERLRIARDPKADPDQLRLAYEAWLGRQTASCYAVGSSTEYFHEDLDVADALAANPNLPRDLLPFFAYCRPAAFCRNPAAPLLPLEMPDLVPRLNRDGVGRLLRCAEVPPSIVRLIATEAADPWGRAEARLHVAFSADPPAAWQEEAREVLRTALLYSPGMQDPLEQELFKALAAAGCVPVFLCRGATTLAIEGLAMKRVQAAQTAVGRARSGDSMRWHAEMNRCFGLAHAPAHGEESEGWDWDSVLEDNTESPKWLERFGVALAPRVRALPEVLSLLMKDGIRPVREAARARLRGEDVTL